MHDAFSTGLPRPQHMLRLVPVKHEEILLHKIGHHKKMGGPFSETLFLRLGLPLLF